MVILGTAQTVANAILRLSSQVDLMGLALIFKLGVMPYDIGRALDERLRRRGGAEDPPRSRPRCRSQPPNRSHRIERGRDFGLLDGGQKLSSPHERPVST